MQIMLPRFSLGGVRGHAGICETNQSRLPLSLSLNAGHLSSSNRSSCYYIEENIGGVLLMFNWQNSSLHYQYDNSTLWMTTSDV